MPDNKSPLSDAKKLLRREIRSKLARLSSQEQQQESALVSEKLADYLKKTGHASSRIATFAAFGKELDLAILHKKLPSATFYYPLCKTDCLMSFHHISSPEHELYPGYIGLREPARHSPVLPPAELDVIIVPGLAFTHGGCRLGKGAGFYDRYLAQDGVKALLLGAAFTCQMTDELPCGPFDMRVNKVFTAE